MLLEEIRVLVGHDELLLLLWNRECFLSEKEKLKSIALIGGRVSSDIEFSEPSGEFVLSSESEIVQFYE